METGAKLRRLKSGSGSLRTVSLVFGRRDSEQQRKGKLSENGKRIWRGRFQFDETGLKGETE